MVSRPGFFNLFPNILLSLWIAGSLVGCTIMETKPDARRQVRDQKNLSTQGEKNSGPRKRVGVLPFLDFGQRPESLPSEAQIRFIEEMNKEGQLIGLLVNRSEMSHCPLHNEEYDLPSCAKDSQKLGYQALIEGKILDFRMKKSADAVGIIRNTAVTYEAVLRLRVYSVRGHKEVFNTDKTVTYTIEGRRIGERETGETVTVSPDMMEKIIVEGFLEYIPQIQNVLGRMNWEGRIAAIQGQKIYLNVGSLSGVQVGDLLRVFDEGPEIYDPEMGTAIGKAPGAVKGTLEVVSYFGHDGAVAIIHSGGGFKENDRVQLY